MKISNRIKVSLTVKATQEKLMDNVLYDLKGDLTDLPNLIYELQMLKNECNSIANQCDQALARCDMKIQFTPQ